MLAPSWDHIGVMLASSWGHSGFMLASSWDHFEVMLASSWDQFGVSLGSFRHRSGTNDFTKMSWSRFLLQNQDLRPSPGAKYAEFRALPVPTGPGRLKGAGGRGRSV